MPMIRVNDRVLERLKAYAGDLSMNAALLKLLDGEDLREEWVNELRARLNKIECTIGEEHF